MTTCTASLHDSVAHELGAWQNIFESRSCAHDVRARLRLDLPRTALSCLRTRIARWSAVDIEIPLDRPRTDTADQRSAQSAEHPRSDLSVGGPSRARRRLASAARTERSADCPSRWRRSASAASSSRLSGPRDRVHARRDDDLRVGALAHARSDACAVKIVVLGDGGVCVGLSCRHRLASLHAHR